MTTPTRPAPRGARRNVTINDVARAAGVGRQTVSNVLNQSGRVGPAARARVLAAVDDLGYQPHHGARSLRSRRTMQLAYLMPEIQLQPSNLIMMQFLQSLVAAGARRHYRVVIVPGQADPGEEIRRLVASRSVDGFVLTGLPLGDPRADLVAALGVPFVCFGRTRPGLPQHWAYIDNTAAEAQAVRHVLGQGYTRPGYVGYASGSYWDGEREDGFRAGLASGGIPGEGAGLLRLADDGDNDARTRIRAFLSAAQPDAVLTSSDKIAAIIYGVAAGIGLRVGADLAVAGFDGSIGAGLLYPQLTSVLIPVDEIAARLVDRLLRQIEHGPDGNPGEFLPAPLRPAGSTARRG